MTDEEKIKQSLLVAHLYYEENMGQAAIAKKLNLSRPTISRLLRSARDSGLVKIQIFNPLLNADELSQQLSQKYGAKIMVVPSNFNGETLSINSVGAYTADFLTKIVRPDDIIGIGWGKTIHSVTTRMENQEVPGVQVVQLKGSVNFENERTYAYESINELGRIYHTQPQYLPLPTIFDNQVTKEMVEQDRFIKAVLDCGKKANIAIFSVGTVRKSALLFQLGYFDEGQKENLQDHAVGDIVSRFINKDGELVDEKLNERTVGIQLSDLKEKRYSILVASGVAKLAGVNAVLTAGYANHAVIDLALAQALIDYEREQET